jgi:hypothetical protein
LRIGLPSIAAGTVAGALVDAAIKKTVFRFAGPLGSARIQVSPVLGGRREYLRRFGSDSSCAAAVRITRATFAGQILTAPTRDRLYRTEPPRYIGSVGAQAQPCRNARARRAPHVLCGRLQTRASHLLYDLPHPVGGAVSFALQPCPAQLRGPGQGGVSMKLIFAGTVFALGLALPAHGDVTLKQTTGGKGMGISGKANGVTYIKGHKMRSDVAMGDKTQTMIFDVDAQKLYMFDSKKKEADVWDMSTFGAELSKAVDVSGTKASLKSNGQTKQITGHSAAGYDMEISMQSAMAGSKDMAMTVTLSGPVWIVKNAPGSADYARFYKAAVEKGWIFSDPRGAKAQPGQAKAMAEMYRQMADIGGIPYSTDVQIKMSGSGPMAGLLSKIGGVTMTTTVDSVDVGPLSDDLFAPPAGYKLNQKK